MNDVSGKYPAMPFVAPFAAYVILLGLKNSLPIDPTWEYPIRTFIVVGVLLLVSRPVICWRPSRLVGSVILGVAVFVIWIGPDLTWPSYRHHWLFENSLMGTAKSSLPEG